MKKSFLTILLLSISFFNLHAQKNAQDYEILNKLFQDIVKDSSEAYFLCGFDIDEKLTYHVHNNMMYMAGQLSLSDEFKHYTSKDLTKRIGNWKWDSNKISYPYIVRTKTDEKEKKCFSISKILYSKSKKYFFVAVDHETHTGTAIYEIMEDGSIRSLKAGCLRMKTPAFR